MAYIRNILLLLITINIVIAQDTRPSVAVLDFDAKGIPEPTMVNFIIYDIMGRTVATLINEQKNEGYHSIVWNTRNQIGVPVAAGIYFYQIQTNNFVKTKKMVILK